MHIETLFDAFTQYAETSKSQLETMLSLISDGKIPTEESVRDLHSTIDCLRDKYSSIYHAALEQLPAEEMPAENAAVAVYINAIRSSQSVQIKKRLDAATDCLRKFLSVRSLTDKYLNELAPFQSEAKEILLKLQEPTPIDIEQIEECTHAPLTLVTAIECSDEESEDKMDLCESLAELYNPRISLGAATGKYYIDVSVYEQSLSTPTDGETVSSKEEDLDPQPGISVTSAEKQILPEIPETAETHEVPTAVLAGERQPAPITTGNTHNVSAFVSALQEAGCIYDSDSDFGTIEAETSSNSSKKTTASIFINELKQGRSLLAEKKIVQSLSKRNFVSHRLLTELYFIPEDLASDSLTYMFKKGYLRKYYLSPINEEIYFASPRLIKSLTYHDACKTAGVKKLTEASWGESVEDTPANVATRVALSEGFIHSADFFQSKRIPVYSESICLMGSAFFCSVYDTSEPDNCEITMGEFWTSDQECDNFLQTVQACFRKLIGLSSIIFASHDLSNAAAFAEIMLRELEGLTFDAPVSLYSLSDRSYYAYPSLKPITETMTSRTVEIADVPEVDSLPQLPSDSALEECPSSDGAPSKTEIIDVINTPTAIASFDVEELPGAEELTTTEDSIAAEAPTTPEETSVAEEIPAAAHNISHIRSGRGALAPSFPFEDIKDHLFHILCKKQYYAATAYLKSLSDHNEEVKHLYTQLAYALNDPMGLCNYTSSNAFDLITKRDVFEDYLMVATALRIFFSNQVRFDYSLKSLHSSIREYSLLSHYPSLGGALYKLVEFKDTHKKGMDAYADYRVKSRTDLEREIQSLQKEALHFYENFVVGRKKENCSQKRFLETKTLMFSHTSDFGCYLKSVVDGDFEYTPLICEFLQKNFYSDASVIAEDTYDMNMLWNYICQMWDNAGKLMKYKRHEDLKSRLRNNITNQTVKAVQILAKWVSLCEQMNGHNDDDGTVQYKKMRQSLQDDLETALAAISSDLTNTALSDEDVAGLSVLDTTIRTLLSCIDGSYQEYTKKYFYLPFLLTDDVTLDENLAPDLHVYASDLDVLHPSQRILMHVQKRDVKTIDFPDRLHIILNAHGDDYGSASQIAEYLSVVSPGYDIADILSQIESGVPYAKQGAEIAQTDFIGELELAQSYGQIDCSVEDKKEMILQIVSEWYDWANDTFNYGFFRKVMNTYLSDIKETAKSRGEDLEEQLEKIKATPLPGISMDLYNSRIKCIQEMIDAQNYTVAEDYLARINSTEDDTTEYIEEDFLKDFLENYYDYYTPVAKPSSFASLVSNRTRNKEDRGAKRLADNWLPGGSDLGRERLGTLLSCLGFKIDTITAQPKIGKFEHFYVKGKHRENGKRVVYNHPIAALASSISETGMRIVCINGAYDAEGLIDIMKDIGDAKHTIILINTALSIGERRRLARKSKSALGEKLFAVIDRTVMMFLVRNYDETKINRMLISLVTPFGYYQPYVADSANIMPPEIFMGRKVELERIKSDSGVNIVYGGRQLGKSALLKKAKEEIDRDENGSRAVYVEIRKLNYEQAARKICHELYDSGILEEEIDTVHWDELARAIKRRLLSSTAPAIPYLLLLIDEADTFIESCEAVKYNPFDELKGLQNIGSKRFKFVVAGLHNVVRFKRAIALDDNNVLTHMQSMTVKPFTPSEARELLTIPLHYLGLRFPKEKQSLITLILATTNYFPGLIQLYCTKLLEAMRNTDYAGYNESNTPLYEISEGHIKKVLADPSFTNQIWEKFEITLKLDEDNYYYLIALLMAYLYHNNGYNAGYSAQDIKDAASILSIRKIDRLSEERLRALMEELRELNVLRNTDETHYLFTRVAFFQMLGTIGDVEDKLMSYMEV